MLRLIFLRKICHSKNRNYSYTKTLATISKQNAIEMKKILHKIFLTLIGIVLIGKISNWFLNYSDETNQILNAGMFTLIGIAYLVGGFVWDKKLVNIIFMTCGIYLIVMNFIGDFGLKSIIGIVCILTPMLIARFLPNETDEKELAEK